MKMMDNDTGPVPRRYSDAGSVERLVGLRASRYASGRPSLRRAGESGAGGLPPRQSHLNVRTAAIAKLNFAINCAEWRRFVRREAKREAGRGW